MPHQEFPAVEALALFSDERRQKIFDAWPELKQGYEQYRRKLLDLSREEISILQRHPADMSMDELPVWIRTSVKAGVNPKEPHMTLNGAYRDISQRLGSAGLGPSSAAAVKSPLETEIERSLSRFAAESKPNAGLGLGPTAAAGTAAALSQPLPSIQEMLPNTIRALTAIVERNATATAKRNGTQTRARPASPGRKTKSVTLKKDYIDDQGDMVEEEMTLNEYAMKNGSKNRNNSPKSNRKSSSAQRNQAMSYEAFMADSGSMDEARPVTKRRNSKTKTLSLEDFMKNANTRTSPVRSMNKRTSPTRNASFFR